jgi:hypothetical protein
LSLLLFIHEDIYLLNNFVFIKNVNRYFRSDFDKH